MKPIRSIEEMKNIIKYCTAEINRLNAEHEARLAYNPEATPFVTAISNYRATITRMKKKIAKAEAGLPG